MADEKKKYSIVKGPSEEDLFNALRRFGRGGHIKLTLGCEILPEGVPKTRTGPYPYPAHAEVTLLVFAIATHGEEPRSWIVEGFVAGSGVADVVFQPHDRTGTLAIR